MIRFLLEVNMSYFVTNITKEYDNSNGLLYNFNGVKEIESKLKENNSNWRVPTFEDWGQMLNALEIYDNRNHLTLKNGDFGLLAGAYLKNDGLYWLNEVKTSYSYGFKANSCGFKTSPNDIDSNFSQKTRFWTNNINVYDEVWVKELDTYKTTVKNTAGDKEGLYSLRLVKDYENNNATSENILGDDYDIIRMPYIIVDAENNVTQRGYRIWTSVNIKYIVNEKNYSEVNSGEAKTPLFYLNYWNGDDWVKRIINENNIVTIEDRDNKEYKLLNNDLIVHSSSEDINLSDYYTKIEANEKFQDKGEYALKTDVENLVSLDNVKTINGESIIGVGNIEITSSEINQSEYYKKNEIDSLLIGKQNTLISGTNIKTINNNSILGVGNLNIGDHSTEINNLKATVEDLYNEITYLKKIISHYSGIDIINNKYSDETIKTLDTSINNLQSDTNELNITKNGNTAFIDLSKENLGGVMVL